ncbi:hypothetical protein FHY56_11485 [Brucella gallinifaecis]|uniref:Uncharacterized protein n=1 Tax=Brucella gallinifaecis TaxID=215590 RepID=A0A502BLY9_9HYPH|nr:hypothetical protein FHY56_11485 [Brucella gallinifaecis]
MTGLERLERILDLHVNHRSWLAHRQDMPSGCIKTGAQGANWFTGSIPARRVGRNTQYFRQMSTPAPQIHEVWSRKLRCRGG